MLTLDVSVKPGLVTRWKNIWPWMALWIPVWYPHEKFPGHELLSEARFGDQMKKYLTLNGSANPGLVSPWKISSPWIAQWSPVWWPDGKIFDLEWLCESRFGIPMINFQAMNCSVKPGLVSTWKNFWPWMALRIPVWYPHEKFPGHELLSEARFGFPREKFSQPQIA